MENDNTNRRALEAFVIDNDELERLESLLGQFNFFEAIGAVRQELRHSDFLGFLLDPSRNHGLGDEFARMLLQKVLGSSPARGLPVSLIDLAVWNLEEIEVYREWQNIDLLLLDHVNRFAVVIENKIGSGERSGQLQRYRLTIAEQYPDLKLVCIFLTPDGDQPSDENYLAADYSTVCEIVEKLIEKRGTTLGSDVRTLLAHYAQMLRRHIMSESEIAELCRRIYRKHRVALDLIFEHRPDQQAVIRDILVNLIEGEPLLRIDTVSKSLIRFTAQEWDTPVLLQAQGWTKSRQILLFEFYIRPHELNLILYLGPGSDDVRHALFTMAQAETGAFRSQSKTLNQKWNSLYRKKFLKEKDFEDDLGSDLEGRIKKFWEEFFRIDLPKMMDAVRANPMLSEIKV